MAKEAIYEKAKQSILEADEDMALEAFEEAQAENLDLVALLTEGYSAGMKEIGDLFGMGEVFLPELIFASEVMKTVSEKLEENMDMSSVQQKGTLVIGTVEGDVHDIGKGIVASLVKTNGINVIDLGREVPAQNFIDAAIENNDIQKAHDNIIKTEHIIDYLRDTLDMKYPVAQDFENIYSYLDQRLLQANIKKDPEILEEVNEHLRAVRDNWKEVMRVNREKGNA